MQINLTFIYINKNECSIYLFFGAPLRPNSVSRLYMVSCLNQTSKKSGCVPFSIVAQH